MYGYERSPPKQVGVIHPDTSITSILVDAYDDAVFHIENCYMVAPKVNIKSNNSSNNMSTDEPASGVLIPSHLYLVFYEILKNAMRATVEYHWNKKEDLPAIEVLICQADDDFTIKISDNGGGVPRATSEKLFYYLYSTDSTHSEVDQTLGYGLPLARLYTRYFHGDLRIASYEGFGTDVYIYIKALASNAFERLPVYNKESLENWLGEQNYDWTSCEGSEMMQGPERVKCHELPESCSFVVKPKV